MELTGKESRLAPLIRLPVHASAPALQGQPALVVDPRLPGGLERAFYEALRAAGLQQQPVAVFFVPIGPAAVAEPASLFAEATLLIDLAAHEVLLRGQLIHLTAKEFALLSYLFERRGNMIGREVLLRDVWGEDYRGGARTVDVHVRRLRRKLGSEWLTTVRGHGYKFSRRSHAQLRSR